MTTCTKRLRSVLDFFVHSISFIHFSFCNIQFNDVFGRGGGAKEARPIGSPILL